MFLKHKSMRDVVMWVLNPEDIMWAEPSRLRVRWVNTAMGKPFIINTPVQEVTLINIQDWREVPDVEAAIKR